MPHNQARAVIFDLDGTLLDTLPDIARAINSVLAQEGFPEHPVPAFARMVGSGIRVAVERALDGLAVSDARITDLSERVSRAYAADPVAGSRFYPGMPEVLTELQARDLPLAILSNKPDRLLQIVAERFLADWHFVKIVGQMEGVPKKPAPDVAVHIAHEMGIPPENIVFLGDSDIDMQTALSSGMIPVGAAWGFRGEAELRASGAKIVLERPLELVELMRSGEGVPS